jgi:hypothetical protein
VGNQNYSQEFSLNISNLARRAGKFEIAFNAIYEVKKYFFVFLRFFQVERKFRRRKYNSKNITRRSQSILKTIM